MGTNQADRYPPVNGTAILTTTDPSSAGLYGRIGQSALNTVTGTMYFKTGTGDTDWTAYGGGGGNCLIQNYFDPAAAGCVMCYNFGQVEGSEFADLSATAGGSIAPPAGYKLLNIPGGLKGLHTDGSTMYIPGNPVVSAWHLTGEYTHEHIYTFITKSEIEIQQPKMTIGGATDIAADNVLIESRINGTFWEYSDGVNVIVGNSPTVNTVIPTLIPVLYTVTRGSTGVVKIYINGVLWSESSTNTMPTGGVNAYMSFRGINCLPSAIRLLNYEMTEEQQAASYAALIA